MILMFNFYNRFRQFKALEEVKTYYKTEPEEEGAALK